MNFKSCQIDLSYIKTHENKVIDVEESFLKLTKYNKKDIINKNINYILYNLLRLHIDITELYQNQESYFIFTKELDLREVQITIKANKNEKLIIFGEIPYSRLDEILPHILSLSSNKNLAVAVYSVPDQILVNANEAYLKFLIETYNKRENSFGKKINEIYKDYMGSKYEKNITRLINTGEIIFCNDFVPFGQDGQMTYWDLQIVPIYQYGKLKYFVSIYKDVTERLQHTKHLEEQNKIISAQNKKLETITKQIMQDKFIKRQVEQIKAVIENMSDAIFIFDNNNKYIFVNKAARELCPFMDKKVRNCFDFAKFFNIDGSEVTYDEIPLNLVRNGQQVIDKTIYTVINDKKQYVGISGTPIFDENNNFVLGVMCSRDITPRIEYEKALRDKQEALLTAERKEKEALESAIKIKDEFLANMSHEFRTPLTVINAAIQTINSLYSNELSNNLKKHIKTIQTNSLRQLKLVNNLLDITKYKEGYIKFNEQNVDIVFLTHSITECIKPFARQKGVRLKFSSSLNNKFVAIDKDKYEQILFNLLSNAIKFTPSGKSIFVHITAKNKFATISVKDEGIGIAKEKHEFIFERFGQVDTSLTRQAEGSGIGLSLVKSIIEALKGTISLESEIGMGSTFTFSIPIKKAKTTVKTKNIRGELSDSIMQSATIEFSNLYL